MQLNQKRRANDFPSCTGPCAQGHAVCLTPNACRLPDDKEAHMGTNAGVFIWPLISTGVVFAVLLIVHFWRGA